MDSPSLVVVGELNADLILTSVQALPELGKEQLAEGMTLTLGSSSAILASNAGALGVDVGFVGRTGDDVVGERVREALDDRGIDVRHVLDTPDDATGLTVIYTHGDDRGMMTYPGAMEALTIDDIPWDYVAQANHVHLSSFYLQKGLRSDVDVLFRRAKAHGLTTSLDTNWDPDEQWDGGILDVLEAVDVFLPNDDEARRIAGEEHLGPALARLGQRANVVVATRGSAGATVRANASTQSFSPPRVDPVDAVGAGDSFNAGFLRRYVEGEALAECVRFGLVTGAYSTQAAGGTAAFDPPDAFWSFAAEHLESVPPPS
ncbi:carbohydrate kinase family protein [Salinibacter altiplanensis]|uniref:carbohydrate kinase family protein n=1 Tax=Salinibacter altiplanensis TaxID=1803181 RepID=UPI0012FFE6FE|nr:carbohydrate kinase family protein [Salinibacter altiplanensis]